LHPIMHGRFDLVGVSLEVEWFSSRTI
jgi:hypothetical protein